MYAAGQTVSTLFPKQTIPPRNRFPCDCGLVSGASIRSRATGDRRRARGGGPGSGFIKNTIGPLLNTAISALGDINGIAQAFSDLWQKVVYPIALITQAQAMVAQVVAMFTGLAMSIHNVDVLSATLPNPTALEVIIRNRSVTDFGQFDQEMMNLALNEQIVVTVPANTRFFIVLQDSGGGERTPGRTTPTGAQPGVQFAASANSSLPTAQGLRELIELKSELNRMYRDVAATRTSEAATAAQSHEQ